MNRVMIDAGLTRRSIYTAVTKAKVSREPFAHFHLEDLFPEETYKTLIDNFPDPELYHEIRHKDALRPDGTSTRTMLEFHDEKFAKLPENCQRIWSTVRDILCERELQDLIFEKFAAEINERADSEHNHIRLERDESGRVIGFPRPGLYRDAAGYQITPHPDTPLKIVTMQFYLPRDDSQESLGTSLFKRKSAVHRALTPWSGKYARVKKFPFLPNTGYAFAVTQESWHGRETVRATAGDRYSILTFYLRDDVRIKG